MFLGIDVSKATLDVAFVADDKTTTKLRHRVFKNTPAGHQELLAWLQKQRQSATPNEGDPAPVHVCLEATGTYGDAIARALHDAGQTVSIVNPAAIRAFGKSQLKRHKTDKADAQLIARFCALHKPAPWSVPLPQHEQLQALVRRIEALEQMKQMECNRLEVTTCPGVRASLEDHIRYLETQLKATHIQIKEHIQGHPDLHEAQALLLSIPGIAQKTAALVLAELGPIESFANASQVAAFAGLAPCERESGTSVRGKVRLSKVGSPRLRKAFYFPAMTALRCNPLIQALGARLTAAGKCPMQILGAAMRKLLVLAYGVLKSKQLFDPNFCLQKT